MKKLKYLVTVILALVIALLASGSVKAETTPLVSINETSGIDGAVLYTGTYMQFESTFTGEVKSDSNIPTLKIKIGNGVERTITTGTITGSKITYKYLITAENQGLVKFVSYQGNVTLVDGTSTEVNVLDINGEFTNKSKIYANSKESGTGTGTGAGTGTDTGVGTGTGSSTGTGSGVGTGSDELTWTDFSRVAFEWKDYTSTNHQTPSLLLKNINLKNSSYYYYYISNNKNDNPDLNKIGSLDDMFYWGASFK